MTVPDFVVQAWTMVVLWCVCNGCTIVLHVKQSIRQDLSFQLSCWAALPLYAAWLLGFVSSMHERTVQS